MNTIALWIGYTTMVLSTVVVLGYCIAAVVEKYGMNLYKTLIAAYSIAVVSKQLQALKNKETE